MSILKIEAFSGLSGDMFLGALADLADAHEELVNLPSMLMLEEVEVVVSEMVKAGIACRHIKIIDHKEYKNHDPGHGHHHHHHAHHRHLKDIEKIIDGGNLTENAKKIAKDIFRLLGEAEAKVHGVDIEKIHFHEVGAIDSILDIVGSAVLLDKLQIDKVYSTAVCTGFGFVMAEHGKMPIPAPATKELLLGMPTYAGDQRGEMVTPTGAAILKYLQPDFDIPVLKELKTAYGPGEKEFPHPNVLRLSLCKAGEDDREEIMMVETNIDDMSPELLGRDFQEALLAAGALDFYFTQVMMKKGRPGVLISVFADRNNLKSVENFLLENTTTIGVRTCPAARVVLKRTQKKVKTSWGEVMVKTVELPSGKQRTTLEYESCKVIAETTGRPLPEIYQLLLKEIH